MAHTGAYGRVWEDVRQHILGEYYKCGDFAIVDHWWSEFWTKYNDDVPKSFDEQVPKLDEPDIEGLVDELLEYENEEQMAEHKPRLRKMAIFRDLFHGARRELEAEIESEIDRENKMSFFFRNKSRISRWVRKWIFMNVPSLTR